MHFARFYVYNFYEVTNYILYLVDIINDKIYDL